MKTLNVSCKVCGKSFKINVKREDYVKWLNGELAQYAFPYLTPDERELLITGICGHCYDKMLGFPDEDDYEEEIEDNYFYDYYGVNPKF